MPEIKKIDTGSHENKFVPYLFPFPVFMPCKNSGELYRFGKYTTNEYPYRHSNHERSDATFFHVSVQTMVTIDKHGIQYRISIIRL